MITHLINTTKFVKVLQQSQLWGNCYDVVCNILEKYANFISQKPELWMFVPCDEEGNVLVEPKLDGKYGNSDSSLYDADILNYRQAQSKVLFKNVEKDLIEYICKYNSLDIVIHKIPKLELTETALKQIL